MKRLILGLAAGLFAAVAVAGTAFAMDPATYADSSLGKILVDPQGMTLYTFDKDKKGETMSACTGKCIGLAALGRPGRRRGDGRLDDRRRHRQGRQGREDVGL